MAIATLQEIRNKVRRLTRSPSTAQMTDSQCDQYINTFMLYDFPAELRLFSLRTTLTFYTQPNVDTYTTNTTNPFDPLYNFKNKYTAIHQPVYLAGIPGFLTQDRSYFYSVWPQTNSCQDTSLRGNNTTGPYSGTLTSTAGSPVLQNSVIFSANDVTGTAMILQDYPVSNTTGALGLPGQPQVLPSPYGQVSYLTGAYTLVFPNAVPNGVVINSESIPYQPAKPIAVLYYDNTFTIRPVPNQVYPIQLEADIRPTELLSVVQVPDEEQWWQYVAIGAAIKVFQDRFDMDSVQLLWPEFKRQEDMVARKSLAQYANERAKTLYTQPKTFGAGWFMTNWPY